MNENVYDKGKRLTLIEKSYLLMLLNQIKNFKIINLEFYC